LGLRNPKPMMPHQFGFTRHQVPVTDVRTSGMNLEEHVVEPDVGLADVSELENVR
jgi:hypothetical protein